jgi:predicted CoA-binding protein
MSTTTVRGQIDQFLASERLAVVGVAQSPQEFAHRLYCDMRQFGYQAIPVNPRVDNIDGERCYSRVQDITPGVQAALLLTPPSANEQVVRDCAEAGIRMVWFYGVGDRSTENAQAIAYCEQHGIEVIPGFCPYMFMSKSPFFHKLHGFVARMTGSAPR